jgi:hypothetical protein
VKKDTETGDQPVHQCEAIAQRTGKRCSRMAHEGSKFCRTHSKVKQQPEDEEYEIEKLVDKKILYKVRWAGYGSDEDTWENAKNLPERSIREFEDKWSKEQSRKGKSSKGQEEKGENGGEE